MLKKHASIPPLHPGEMLREMVLPELGMTKVDIAKALGISRQTLYDILGEKQDVTAEMAVRLGKFLGNGGAFWLRLQRNYDLAQAEQSVDLSQIPTIRTASR